MISKMLTCVVNELQYLPREVYGCKLITEQAQINLSELDAIIFGLQCCIENDYKTIHLKTDSTMDKIVGWG